jgi:hypothetical protein
MIRRVRVHGLHKGAFRFVPLALGAKEKVCAIGLGILLDMGLFDFLESRLDLAQAVGRLDRLHFPSLFDIVLGRVDSFFMNVVWVFATLGALSFLLLVRLRTLLNPMARGMTQTADVSVRWTRLLFLALLVASTITSA